MFEKLKALLRANIKIDVHRMTEADQVGMHHMKARIDFSSSSEDRTELMSEFRRVVRDAGIDPAAQKAAVDDFVARHGLTVQSFEAD